MFLWRWFPTQICQPSDTGRETDRRRLTGVAVVSLGGVPGAVVAAGTVTQLTQVVPAEAEVVVAATTSHGRRQSQINRPQQSGSHWTPLVRSTTDMRTNMHE